ncbi:universal stress protein [Streptomyces sp. NPDC001617]
MSGPVVVGVDGSQSSMAAVETAAREADRLGVELRLAHALVWPSAHVPPGVPPWDRGGAGVRGVVNGALAEAESRAHRAAPSVHVTQDVLMGEPVRVLATESREAALTVVGSRPPGRRGGSVAGQLVAHGSSPLLVVRGRPDPAGPVVLVGSHTPKVRAAAEFAFAEASRRGADLLVLDGTKPGDALPHHELADALPSLREKYPDVVVHHAHVRRGIRRALVEASTTAQLMVVGAEGRGGLADGLGSPVSRVALNHSDCPVVVIRAEGR